MARAEPAAAEDAPSDAFAFLIGAMDELASSEHAALVEARAQELAYLHAKQPPWVESDPLMIMKPGQLPHMELVAADGEQTPGTPPDGMRLATASPPSRVVRTVAAPPAIPVASAAAIEGSDGG